MRLIFRGSLKQTSDGGYIIAGTSTSSGGDLSVNHGGSDICIIKISSNGVVQWHTMLGGSQNESAVSIQLSADGGYLVAGDTGSSDGDVSGQHGTDFMTKDIWVVKLSSSGALLWQRCYGGSNIDMTSGFIPTIDGNLILAGVTRSTDGDVMGKHGSVSMPSDAWIVKIDAMGNILWQKCLGGSGFDSAYSIIQTPDGGYLAACGTSSSDGDVSGFHGLQDSWIVKLDTSGSIVWQKCVGDENYSFLVDIAMTVDGGYMLVGNKKHKDFVYTSNDDIRADSWIAKLDVGGTILWERSLGGASVDYLGKIVCAHDGGFISVGLTRSNDGALCGNHGGLYDMWIVKLEEK